MITHHAQIKTLTNPAVDAEETPPCEDTVNGEAKNFVLCIIGGSFNGQDCFAHEFFFRKLA